MKLNFKLKHLGIVVVLLGVALVYLMLSFMNMLGDMSQESCTCNVCSMVEYETPVAIYIGFIVVIILFSIGAYLFFKQAPPTVDDRKNFWSQNLDSLHGEEKTVYQLLIDSDGAMFQNEIVEKTGLSKVKVTRTLDKLESGRLLERRRRGLTNMIVLKG